MAKKSKGKPIRVRPPKNLDELVAIEQRIVRLLNRRQQAWEKDEEKRINLVERQKAKKRRYDQWMLELAKVASAYAQGHRNELLSDGKKSYTLQDGTRLEWYLTRYSVDTSLEDEVLIDYLEKEGLTQYIHTPPQPKSELDRNALLRDRQSLDNIPGLAFTQSEMFATRFPQRVERIVHNLTTNRWRFLTDAEEDLEKAEPAPVAALAQAAE
jgi:phage host-nuclease inhibitor protein Gam